MHTFFPHTLHKSTEEEFKVGIQMARLLLLKVLQKFIYDSMSVKHSTCSVASLAALMWLSSLLLSWFLLGQDQCSVQDNISDNLLGRPLHNQASFIYPIDVVYTWVNGSDPEFQQELHAAESRLQRQTPPGWRQHCPLPSCVPAAQLSIVPQLPRRTTLGDLRFFIPGAAPLQLLPSPLSESPGTVLRFASVDEARSVLQRGAEFQINEDNFTLHQMFWTSDENAVLSAPASDHVILTGPAATVRTLVTDPEWTDAEEVARADDGDVVVLRLPDAAVTDRLLTERNGTVKAARASLVLRLVDAAADAVAPSRFADSQELRYSLRSLERYAPWVRRVFLVTNGQIPDWLALDGQRLTLVTHEDIFPDPSHLPTFSSPAIEAHLHRIPGLSEHFLYFNDDVLLGQPVWPEDFFAPGGGYNVFLAWRVPDCAQDCSAAWLGDGHCDAACNAASCDWDAGDCVGAQPDLPRSASPDPADLDIDHNLGPEDEHMMLAVEVEGACSTGCEDLWLGDQFCDAACDVPACAHDLGDCGTVKLRTLPELEPLRDGAQYAVPAGALAVYWNVTTLPEGLRAETVSFPPRRALRGFSFAPRFGVLTLLLRPNATLGRLPVFLSGTVLGHNGTNEERMIEFHVVSRAETGPPLDLAEEAKHLERLSKTEDEWNTELERRLRAAERRLPNRGAYLRRRVELLLSAAAAGNATIDGAVPDPDPAPPGNSSANQLPSRRLLGVPNQPTGRRLLGARPIALSAADSQLTDLESSNVTHEAPEGLRPRSELPAPRPRYLHEISNPADQLDTYGLSLLKVNRLYTRRYGSQQRRAVAHMPHLLSRAVIADMQAAFADEFMRTSAARVRSGDDMQFAFAYFYFVMSERDEVPVGEIFDIIDTDGSGTWSDREIRTLLTKLKSLPLTLEDLERTWTLLRSCAEAVPAESDLSTPAGERYLDSHLPTVTRDAVLACPEMVAQMQRAMGKKPRYRHRVLDSDDVVSFTMVRANASRLVGALDKLRREPRKFICLNNNVGSASEAETRLVYALLVDFLEAILPHPSQFELPANYRNRFQHIHELREWERHRSLLRAVTALLTLLLVLSLLHAQFGSLFCARRRRTRRPAQQV